LGKGDSGLFQGTILNLSGDTEEDHEKSVRIVGAPTKIQTIYLPNTNHKHNHSKNLLSQLMQLETFLF